MIVLQGIVFVLLFSSTLACGYYYLLLFVFLFRDRTPSTILPASDIYRRIVVIIPAHNEEECIQDTLQSCTSIDYPKDKFHVVVIADNCQDMTATLVRHAGVRVLERFDEQQKGKGHALAFAFAVLLKENFDAFLIIDADCAIDAHALLALNTALGRGYGAAQLNYVVANPDASPMTYALAVGNYMENMLFYSPKSLLGWAVLLRGTGMLLAREVLTAIPWQAFSVTEDVEYGIQMLQSGYHIAFMENARVVSPFPVDCRQLQVQRTRWASGNIGFGRKEALKMVITGLKRHRWVTVDSGITFLVLSKPLMLLCSGGAFLLAFFCFLLQSSLVTQCLLIGSSIVGGLLVLYFSLGVFFFGLTKQRWKLLLQTPVTVIRLMWIALLAFKGNRAQAWHRTPR